MNVSQRLVAAALAVSAAVVSIEADGVALRVDQVRQRYPWNGLVDIDYTITKDDNELELDVAFDRIEFTFIDHQASPVTTNVAHVFRQGVLPVSAGSHRVTWDANAENVTFVSKNVEVTATLAHYAERYMVIDVSEGKDADYFPVTYIDAPPEGGFTNETYRSTKIALRLIPPGSYLRGSPEDEQGRSSGTPASETLHPVAISKPFCMGVFQVTQAQYFQVTGTERKGTAEGLYRPACKITFSDAVNFMNLLSEKCRAQDPDTKEWNVSVTGFTLPTEGQWEYACRAGTDTPCNCGVPCTTYQELEAEVRRVSRYKGNQSEGDYRSGHTTVGSYVPNAWNLYDMLGNAWEWCSDLYREDAQNLPDAHLDPKGGTAGTDGVMRGGAYGEAYDNRSARRLLWKRTDSVWDNFAFRIARNIPE